MRSLAGAREKAGTSLSRVTKQILFGLLKCIAHCGESEFSVINVA
jgi:hypothetical protein